MALLNFFKSVATIAFLAASGAQAAQNSLQQVTANIGPNPNNVGMYVYKPTKLASPTPLIVAVHYCTGTAQAYFSGTQYANLADTYGFIVIYPNAPRSGGCFDVHSDQTLKHDAGGDSQGIASMVTYAIANYGVAANKVYITGTSSGAMMTQVMAGAYPNLFQATSEYNGVPFACFAGTGEWNSACANGQVSKTAQAWGDLVRAAYPGYTGSRPKMMLWHGTTDSTLYYANFGQSILQWTNVLGVSSTATTTTSNNPQSSYTKTTYGSVVVAYSAAGVGHTVPVHEAIELDWFGITGSTVTTTPITTSTTTTTPGGVITTPITTSTTTTTTSTTPPVTGGTVAHWGQCGGIGYIGPQGCIPPYTCKYSNDWYSQCL